MNAVVIYESLTGTTAKAATLIAEELTQRGVTARVYAVDAIDYQALSDAELVIVGGWTDGFVFIGQKPGRVWRLQGMPAIAGKKAFVFATYAVDPGKTLEKLVAVVEERGAEVLGGRTIRRGRVESSAHEFVEQVLEALAKA